MEDRGGAVEQNLGWARAKFSRGTGSARVLQGWFWQKGRMVGLKMVYHLLPCCSCACVAWCCAGRGLALQRALMLPLYPTVHFNECLAHVEVPCTEGRPRLPLPTNLRTPTICTTHTRKTALGNILRSPTLRSPTSKAGPPSPSSCTSHSDTSQPTDRATSYSDWYPGYDTTCDRVRHAVQVVRHHLRVQRTAGGGVVRQGAC